MSQYLQSFFVHLNLQIRSKHVGKTSNILLAWPAIRNFAWQSAPPKEFHKQCDAWPEWYFGEFAIKQKWYISPPYTFCYFNMPKLPEGSGDFQGMNELIQLNAVVASSSVPMRLGWPALDWCKESVCVCREVTPFRAQRWEPLALSPILFLLQSSVFSQFSQSLIWQSCHDSV